MRSLLALCALLLSNSASALDQFAHRDLTRETCVAAGLPELFCAQAAESSQNVDGHEWDDMAAHAQAEAADAMCAGAGATVERVHAIGKELNVRLALLKGAPHEEERQVAASRLSEELGRALHTFQDLCAHQGMTNTQPAWFSL